MKRIKPKELPPKSGVIDLTKNLGYYLFPFIEGGKEKRVSLKSLRKQLVKILKPLSQSKPIDIVKISNDFFNALPSLRESLYADAKFIEANDPAATYLDEVIMAYPGFYAIMVYRLANKLHLLGVTIVPRIMTEHAHSQTGIDIHPGATIGNEFFIDHGTGIVIGETSIIGDRVKMYQGVTIGALNVCKDSAQVKRHPTIEDDVVIYAGATILGGKTIIGHQSIVGGNVWLTKSIPPNSIVQHEAKVSVKKNNYPLN